MRRHLLVTACLLLTTVSTSAGAAVYMSQFPARMGDFIRSGQNDYQDGLGWSVEYNRGNTSANIQVYDRGRTDIPNGSDSKVLKAEWKQAAREFRKAVEGVRIGRGTRLPELDDTRFLQERYTRPMGENRGEGLLLMTALAGKFIGVSLLWPEGATPDAAVLRALLDRIRCALRDDSGCAAVYATLTALSCAYDEEGNRVDNRVLYSSSLTLAEVTPAGFRPGMSRIENRDGRAAIAWTTTTPVDDKSRITRRSVILIDPATRSFEQTITATRPPLEGTDEYVVRGTCEVMPVSRDLRAINVIAPARCDKAMRAQLARRQMTTTEISLLCEGDSVAPAVGEAAADDGP